MCGSSCREYSLTVLFDKSVMGSLNMLSILEQRFRRRAISPVIATVLLIGLVVIAGLGVALVMISTINAPDPIGIEVLSISNFETTDDDILVDRFEIEIWNSEETSLRLTKNGIKLLYFNLR